MKQLSRIAAAAALAAGALVSTGASAATICTSCSYTSATNNNLFIGSLSALTGDNSFLLSGSTLQNTGAFTQNFIFNFAPIGSAASNLSFTPQSAISNFKLELLSVTATGCPMLTMIGGFGFGNGGCTSFAPGALIATAATGPSNFVNLPFTPITAGQYLIRVTGIVTQSGGGGNPDNGYSGQVTTQNVPEPGSLALAGLALVGAAFAARRRKA